MIAMKSAGLQKINECYNHCVFYSNTNAKYFERTKIICMGLCSYLERLRVESASTVSETRLGVCKMFIDSSFSHSRIQISVHTPIRLIRNADENHSWKTSHMANTFCLRSAHVLLERKYQFLKTCSQKPHNLNTIYWWASCSVKLRRHASACVRLFFMCAWTCLLWDASSISHNLAFHLLLVQLDPIYGNNTLEHQANVAEVSSMHFDS